jgi:hypothetical protein
VIPSKTAALVFGCFLLSDYGTTVANLLKASKENVREILTLISDNYMSNTLNGHRMSILAIIMLKFLNLVPQ